MTSQADHPDGAKSTAPFGSRRDLPKTPICVLGLLYVLWLIALVWMAVSESMS